MKNLRSFVIVTHLKIRFQPDFHRIWILFQNPERKPVNCWNIGHCIEIGADFFDSLLKIPCSRIHIGQNKDIFRFYAVLEQFYYKSKQNRSFSRTRNRRNRHFPLFVIKNGLLVFSGRKFKSNFPWFCTIYKIFFDSAGIFKAFAVKKARIGINIFKKQPQFANLAFCLFLWEF